MWFLGLLLYASLLQSPSARAEEDFQGVHSLREEPLTLQVKSISVTRTKERKAEDRNIAGFPEPLPDKILNWWLRDRFRASGKQGYVEFVIDHLHVTETPVKRKKGLFEAPNICFEADLSLTVRIGGFTSSPTELCIRVRSRRTEPESLSLYERQKTWIQLVESAINNLNQELMRKPAFQSLVASPS